MTMRGGPHNHHATAFVHAGQGVMIEGASGTGKSSLALALLDRAALAGIDARLIADDQLFLSAIDGRLVAEVPPAIAGLIEIWPLGPRPIPHIASASIDWVVELVAPETLSRIEEVTIVERIGLSVPLIRLPANSTAAALRALTSLLDHPTSVQKPG